MVKVDETRKLPVWATVTAAYGFGWDNRGQFLRLAALPVTAAIVIEMVNDTIFDIDAFASWKESAWARRIAYWSVGPAIVAVMTPFYVAWSRLLLMREIDPAAQARLRLGRRDARYLMWTGIISLVALLLLLLASFASGVTIGIAIFWADVSGPEQDFDAIERLATEIWTGAGVFALMFAIARLALVLPAVSVGQRLLPAESWRLTRNSGWRIASALFAAGLPLYAVIRAFAVLDLSTAQPAAYATTLVLKVILYAGFSAVAVTVTCLCFCVFTGWPRRDLLNG